MKTILSALAVGLAYALATANVEFWLSTLRMHALGMPALASSNAKAIVLELLLGIVLGAVTLPVRVLTARIWLQAACIAAIWIALARTVAVDPANLQQWLMAPASGILLLAVGALIARRARSLPWLLASASLLAALAYPQVFVDAHEDRGVVQGEAVAGAPDVVVIVLDTVRAASTSTYGYERETTPFLSKLAAEGVLFADATSPSTWSLPSHASLFTGWYPSAHGAHGEHRVLTDRLPTLADVLRRNGYDTFCFTANPHISDGFGLTRGFSYSDRAYLAGGSGRSFVFIYRVLDLLGISADDKGGGLVADNFARWLERREGERPAFVFINFLEAHFPYHQVPQEFLARYTRTSQRELRQFSLETFGAAFGRRLTSDETAAAIGPTTDMYDAGVRYSDHLLERVVEGIRASGRLDDTVLVVLADHGELLGEHGHFGHGASVLQPDLHVPLVIRYPKAIVGGSRVRQPISTVGVYGTVLDLLNVDPPGPLQVGSLLPSIDGEAIDAPILAERYVSMYRPRGKALPFAHNLRYRVYRSANYKLIEEDAGDVFLFNLAEDPNELDDLAAREPQVLARVRAELRDWEQRLNLPDLGAPVDAAAEPEMDPATRDRLKALGYLD